MCVCARCAGASESESEKAIKLTGTLARGGGPFRPPPPPPPPPSPPPLAERPARKRSTGRARGFNINFSARGGPTSGPARAQQAGAACDLFVCDRPIANKWPPPLDSIRPPPPPPLAPTSRSVVAQVARAAHVSRRSCAQRPLSFAAPASGARVAIAHKSMGARALCIANNILLCVLCVPSTLMRSHCDQLAAAGAKVMPLPPVSSN